MGYLMHAFPPAPLGFLRAKLLPRTTLTKDL